MKVFVLLILIFIFVGSSVFAQKKITNVDGFWTGKIDKDGKNWRVDLNIKKQNETYKAFVDFIDIDGYGREFSVKQTDDLIRLERPQPSGISLVFEGSIDGDIFKGNWSGLGQTASFILQREKAKSENFHEREVSFKNGAVTLSGTLIMPKKTGKFAAVVITHGSFPNERDSYKTWALHFVRKGIAALIYDKRGSGKSSGETRSASMENLADDAIAGVNIFKTFTEIDAKKIGVVGHSQGGWIAPLAATRSKDVAFVIASAASGVSPDKQSIFHRANVMREMGFSENEINIATDLRTKLYTSGKLLLENSPNAKEERKKVSTELAKYAKEPWFERGAELPPNLDGDKPSRGALELLFFEPEPIWEKVKVPVLIVWGDKDTIVPVGESKTIIENAVKKSGNKQISIKIFPNVNHGIVVVRPPNSEWDFPRVDLNYYKTIVEWLNAKINNQ